ncbi:MAG: FAD-dependent oxidoreductase, partial [Desulfobacterales bacterium]|nr:FAD-dependent oxidoreductase [Desulfobacterales bacterium]
ESVEDFRKLTAAVHAFETPVFAQLRHHGFQSSGAISRKAIWGPSALSDIVFGETAKPLEGEEMEELLESYSRAAWVAREGGFDGLEIDMGTESLLRQFLSPISNLRQDEYGGSLENRMRFPIGVIEGVRRGVGHDFTVGVRLCVDERFWGGITPDESREMAKGLEATGKVDFINTSLGTYYNLHLSMASMHTPSGFAIEAAEQIKKSVNLPVIASHQIDTPQQANDILEHGRADAVGLIRNLICDPDAPKKAREGRAEDIRYCVRENEGCIGRTNQSKTLSCIQNPNVGYEYLSGEEGYFPCPQRKRVMIVGGGPAGLEAARVAAEKGHDVTLYEREERIGGQINLAKMGAGRQGLGEIIRYQSHMLKKLQVRLVTGVEVTPELVLEKHPDAVIVATGSKLKARPVPGDYGPPAVLHVRDVLGSRFPVGRKVLFIDEDGGHHATATVEFLADQGKKVDVVTSALFVGMRLAPIGDLYLSRQRLLQKGVTFTTDMVVDEIDEERVKAHCAFTNKRAIFEGYDTIVLDMGEEADEALYVQLKGRVKELYRAGDCVAPRGIGMAILEGKRSGEKL